MTKLVNPTPIFLDGRGALIDAGSIYIGVNGTDPRVAENQINLFWDAEHTSPAAQPLRTLGGVIVRNGAPGFVYFDESDYSMIVLDADANLVTSIPYCNETGGIALQPLDSDLTAIAELATTEFGRAMLTLADEAGLRTAIGLGSIAYLAEATSAQFRSNTPDKALSTDQVWAAAVPVALAEASGSVAVDLNSGFNFTLSMTGGPWTLDNPANGKPGQSGMIEISQDATGSRLLTFGSNWKFVGGVDPELSTAANARDLLTYVVLADGTSVYAALAKGVA